MAGLRRPALGTVRLEAAIQCAVLNVSKVVSNSSDGGPGIGHEQSLARGLETCRSGPRARKWRFQLSWRATQGLSLQGAMLRQ